MKNIDRLSFGVGRLVGSPLTRSLSPSQSIGPTSPQLIIRDPEIDIEIEDDDEEDEEVDVDVEEVGDEEERDANTSSSSRRSNSTPSPSLTRVELVSPITHLQKKSRDSFSVSALLRPDPPSSQQNKSPVSSPGATINLNQVHQSSSGTSLGLYPPLHLQGGLLTPNPHHPLSYLHPHLLPHNLLSSHLHPLLRAVHPAHSVVHSPHATHGLHHPHPLGDVYSCIKCDKMFSTPHGLEVRFHRQKYKKSKQSFLSYQLLRLFLIYK